MRSNAYTLIFTSITTVLLGFLLSFVSESLKETQRINEELDIMKMEMPPAFRGYGAKGMIIENELSQKRQEEVDKIVSKLKEEGKNRHEIQDKLMQFDLPLNYKELNQRSGVDYE